MAENIGSVEISIGPEINDRILRQFRMKFRVQMERIEREVQPKIGPQMDKGQATKYRQQLKVVTSPVDQKVHINLESDGYRMKLQALTRPVKQEIKLDVDRRALAMAATAFHALRTRVMMLRSAFVALRPLWVGFFALIGFSLIHIFHLIGSLGQVAGVIGGVLVAAMFGAVGATAALALGFRGLVSGTNILTKEMARAHGAFNNWKRIADDLAITFQKRAMPGVENFLNTARRLVPPVDAFFHRFGNTIRRVSNELARFISTPVFDDQFKTILEGNNRALDSFGNMGVQVFRILTSLAAGAVGQLERFANWISRATTRMARFLEAREQSGQLAEDFRKMGDAAAQWGRIFGNIFSALFNTFKAISPITSSIMDKIEALTRKWKRFSQSEEGQRKILDFFQKLQNIPWGTIAKGFTAIALALGSINLARSALTFIGLFQPIAALGPVAMVAGIAIGILALALGGLAAAFFMAYQQSEEFREIINTTLGQIKEALTPVFEEFARIFQEKILPALVEIAQVVGPAVATFFREIAQIFMENKNELLQLVDVIILFAKIFAHWFVFQLKVGAIIVRIFVTAISALIKTWNFLWEVGKAVVAFLVSTWQSFVEDFWRPLISFLKNTWESFMNDFLRPLGDAVKNVWNAIVGFLKDTWNSFFNDFLRPAWNGIKTFALAIWNGIRTGVTTAWNALWNAARTVWNTFGSWIRTGWNAVKNFAINLWNSLRNAVVTAWRTIWFAARRLWNEFKAFIQSAWGAIKNFASNLWTSIRNAVVTAWRTLWLSARRLWNQFKAFIQSAWGAIRSFASNLWNSIKDRVRNAWNALWNAARNLWNQFSSWIRGGWNAIRDFAVRLWNNIKDKVKSIWNTLWETAKRIWNNAKSAIENKVTEFKNKIIDFFKRAAQGIKSWWDKIKNWTKEPINFVINTVWNNGIGGLWNKVKDVFSGMPSFPRATPLATGGVMPGYTPGKDVHLAALSGGEAVMRPEFTRAVGKRQIDAWNRAARTGQLDRGQTKSRTKVKGYASGGVIDARPVSVSLGKEPKIVVNNQLPPQMGGLPDWVPGSGIINNIGSTIGRLAKEGAGKIVEKLFFHNPIVERAAGALESGIDNTLTGRGWLEIPRRFIVGLYDHALASVASIAIAHGNEGSGGDRGVGSSALLKAMAGFVRQAAPGMRVSSGLRQGDPGYHGRSRAIDMVFSDGSQNRSAGQRPGGQAKRAADAIKRHFTANTLELIWDPLGNQAVWNGRRHRFTGGGAGPGTHADHIHWAFGGTPDQIKRVQSGQGGITTAEASGASKFGSLNKATGLFKKYKNMVSLDPSGFGLVNGDGSVMKQAYKQAKSMGASPKVLLALFMAGFVESGFRNLNFGDRDSLGFLQQRPSQGWGTPSQIRNVPYATRSFVSRALQIVRSDPSIGAGALAQAVQRSAFPGRYEQMRSKAIAALKRLEPGIKFDQGGFLPTGTSVVQNNTGSPEPVLTTRQFAAVASLGSDNPVVVQNHLRIDLDGQPFREFVIESQEERDRELIRHLKDK